MFCSFFQHKNAKRARRPQKSLCRGTAWLVLFAPAWAIAADAEVERTWARGQLAWRQDGRVETGSLAASLASAEKALAGAKAPAIVYLHGCAGLDRPAAATAAFLAAAGFVVASPDSFARTTKPPSCKPGAEDLHRGVLAWRRAEGTYAVEQVGRLAFVDAARVYLYGFSEGGAAVATLGAIPVRARVIEGWGCRSGWPEYEGLRAPPGQPVLSLTSGGRGDCGAFMKHRFGSRSVVFRPPDPRGAEHYVSGRAETQATILEFLRSR